MDSGLFDEHSDYSSDISETQSEFEARIYSVIHYNDFSGTTEEPFYDPKYGVEFNAAGEVVVYLKDIKENKSDFNDDLNEIAHHKVIPTIVLDDEDKNDYTINSTYNSNYIEEEFAETHLKKKKKKKNKKIKEGSIQEYIEFVKNNNVLKEYREKSGIDIIKSNNNNSSKMALNVACKNERALPMTKSEVLKQYRIGKSNEDSTWYRCPKTWTTDMIKFYTKIQKSKRNFDCAEELKKIRETQGSNPLDWTLDPSDLYKSNLNTPKIKCNYCRQYGHTVYYCKEQNKPEVCIMCGMEGHNFHNCDKKICFTCGKHQNKFTNNCNRCLSMSRIKCNTCNDYGHDSKYCTESWRQYHNIISTEIEPCDIEFAQSSSNYQSEFLNSSNAKTNISLTSMSDTYKTSLCVSNHESKKAKRNKRYKARRKRNSQNNNSFVQNNDSVAINVNIQDTTLKRTLKKTSFLKKKKMKY
ncbi:zinc finger CCHC domain-containing protein 7 [Daktulosphaira vitifoliae]|uniref:zinc finger CCHC domain-containing protein 7 n=1 Tax=Daktulosphaira vitifoliae TaxID=58002 RepID=UPI0021A9F441|nr:zinc finger CCHC domain-containing protein 7 [Daktulosphaira vitifoliae]